ncbi:hypothetical protein BCON_0325g00010 [Botryotinia convoluta]|uniref:Uncharacterized protein n=1 Tax=Botryotinia convoluta TaxID=54673 RepID=A0A4Z1HN48_9HELO|nr:hypothetical protein BCON_0325g00010 [Botryotinia convoluta]
MKRLWPEKQGSQYSTCPDHAQLVFTSNFLLSLPTKVEFVKFETLLVSYQLLTSTQAKEWKQRKRKYYEQQTDYFGSISRLCSYDLELRNPKRHYIGCGKVGLVHENLEIVTLSPIQSMVLPATKPPLSPKFTDNDGTNYFGFKGQTFGIHEPKRRVSFHPLRWMQEAGSVSPSPTTSLFDIAPTITISQDPIDS